MSNTSAPTKFVFGRYELIPEQHLLTRDGVRVPMGSRAMALLIELVRNAGGLVSTAQLMRCAWADLVVEDNNLRVQIAAIRKALEESVDTRFISTVPMKGYVFVAPVQVAARQLAQPSVVASASLDQAGLGSTGLASLRDQGGSPLPYRRTALIGREASVSALKQALPLKRLVTLVGPAGIGKTAIAVVAATELAADFHDGAFFADLAPLSDGNHVHSAVAAALGIRVLADNPRDAILAGLRDKNLLLVLDNCEHVVEAVAHLVEDILSQAPSVQLIATSREALRTRGERVQSIPTLPAPTAGERLTFDEVCQYPAVQLFLERVQQTHGGTTFGEAEVDTLAWVCRELDGVPLAIELIAARYSMLGLPGLVARMSDRLASLGQGWRSAHPRHKTLRAALDWSYDLLSEQEQRFFRSLAVFRGRFTLEAAGVVGGNLVPGDSLALVSELLGKSLVSFDHRNDVAPYRLLATTRAYAEERLIEANEYAAAAELHLDWLRLEMVAAERSLPRFSPSTWRSQNARHIDDVRAAIRWAREQTHLRAKVIQLIACASPLWFHLGLLSESLAALRWAVNNSDGVELVDDVGLRLALTFAHVSMVLEGPSAEADLELERARTLAAGPGEPILRMQSSWTNFIRSVIAGNYAASLEACEEFRSRAEAAADREALFVYHRMVSLSEHLLGNQAAALKHSKKALAPLAGIEMRLLHGDPQQSDHRSASLTHLARILFLQGHTRRAVEVAEEAYQEALEADRRQAPIYALSYGVCPVLIWAGRFDLAARYVELLRDATARNAMPFWSLWPAMYEYVLAKRRAGAQAVADDVEMLGLNAGHKDVLATLGVGYCPPSVLERAQAGKSEWARPEILRVTAAQLMAAGGDLTNVDQLLMQSAQLAKTQGAVAWQLRTALTRAELFIANGKRDEARADIKSALDATANDSLSCEEKKASLFLQGDDAWAECCLFLPPHAG